MTLLQLCIRFWVGLLLVGVTLLAQAGPEAVVLPDNDASLSLAGSVGYRIDDSGQLSLEQVRSSRNDGAFIFPPKPVTLGGDSRPVWFVIRILQQGPVGDWVLLSLIHI